MRTRFIQSCLLLMLCFALAACHDDHDSTGPDYFEIDSVKRPIVGAELRYRAEYTFKYEGAEAFHHRLTFQTVPIGTAPDEIRSEIRMTVTNSSPDLAPGVYTWAINQWRPFNVTDGDISINLSDETIGPYYTLEEGTLSIIRSGDRYAIDFDGFAANAAARAYGPVVLHFEGSLIKTVW